MECDKKWRRRFFYSAQPIKRTIGGGGGAVERLECTHKKRGQDVRLEERLQQWADKSWDKSIFAEKWSDLDFFENLNIINFSYILVKRKYIFRENMKGTSPWANIFEEISIIPTFLHSPSLKLQWKGLNGQLFLLLANMHKAWNRLISLHSFLLNFLKIVVSFERRYFFHAEHNIFIIFSSLSYCYLLRDFCWAGGNQPNLEIFFFIYKNEISFGKSN